MLIVCFIVRLDPARGLSFGCSALSSRHPVSHHGRKFPGGDDVSSKDRPRFSTTSDSAASLKNIIERWSPLLDLHCGKGPPNLARGPSISVFLTIPMPIV